MWLSGLTVAHAGSGAATRGLCWPMPRGISVPQPGVELTVAWILQGRFLTTGPPGKPLIPEWPFSPSLNLEFSHFSLTTWRYSSLISWHLFWLIVSHPCIRTWWLNNNKLSLLDFKPLFCVNGVWFYSAVSRDGFLFVDLCQDYLCSLNLKAQAFLQI